MVHGEEEDVATKLDMKGIVQSAIQQDPTISDPTRIVVSVDKVGPIFRKREVITLEGTVRHPHEVDKVEEVVSRKLPNVPVSNVLKTE